MEIMTQDIAKLTEALAKAKSSFGPIIKNKTVKTTSFSYDYADLASIEEAIRKPLMENGLTIFQPITMVGEQRILITLLSHISGQWIKGEMPLSNYNGKVQDFGKEITYLRRYAMCSLLGITAEEDTDGNVVVGQDKRADQNVKFTAEKARPTTLTKEQADTIADLVKEHPALKEEILQISGKALLKDIEASKYQSVINYINKHINHNIKAQGAA